VWLVSFVLVSVLGALWVFMSPMMASPDEPSQTVKSVAVVRGQLDGTEQVIQQTDEKVLNVVISRVEVPASYTLLDQGRVCFTYKPLVPADCADPISADTSITTGATYVGRYPPVYYATVGWPSLVFPPGMALRAMRLMGVLLCASFIALAVVAARQLDRGGLVVVGLVASITPQVVFFGASINPSGLEMAAGIALWLTAMALVRGSGRPDRGTVARFALTAVVFSWSRPLSALFLVVILVGVWFCFGTRARARELLSANASRIGLGVVAVGWLGSAAWAAVMKSYSAAAGFPLTSASNGELLRTSADMLPYHARQLIGTFGWLDTELTPWAILLWYVGIVAIILLGLAFGRWRERIGIVLVFVGTIALTLGSEVVGARLAGMSWQGRYSFALIVGVPLVAAVSADASGRVSLRFTRVFGTAVIAGVGVVQLVAAFTQVRRYAVGVDHPLLSYLGESRWVPMGNHLWLFIGTWLAVAAYCVGWVLLLRSRTGRAGDAPAADGQEVLA
jgi:hypothetical protein